jgi:hypothetical protein
MPVTEGPHGHQLDGPRLTPTARGAVHEHVVEPHGDRFGSDGEVVRGTGMTMDDPGDPRRPYTRRRRDSLLVPLGNARPGPDSMRGIDRCALDDEHEWAIRRGPLERARNAPLREHRADAKSPERRRWIRRRIRT